MASSQPRTAWDILTASEEAELTRLFRTYGEEPNARRVAHALKEALRRGRLSNDAVEAARVIRGAMPGPPRRIDPATRCFQALRMAVNRELENLERLLAAAPELLAPGGRLAVLAYHSLEDRLAKTAFRAAARGCLCPPQSPQCVCGKKPWARLPHRKAVQAGAGEIAANPRARSVRLRVLEKCNDSDSPLLEKERVQGEDCRSRYGRSERQSSSGLRPPSPFQGEGTSTEPG